MDPLILLKNRFADESRIRSLSLFCNKLQALKKKSEKNE